MSTEKDSFATPAAITITLASLASSTAGVGRQGTLVANTNGYPLVLGFLKTKLGTSPSAGGITVYLIRFETTGGVATDSAGNADAAITILNATPVAFFATKASPATGDVIQGDFQIDNPGPNWTLAIVQNTVAALDSTSGNHLLEFVGVNPTFA